MNTRFLSAILGRWRLRASLEIPRSAVRTFVGDDQVSTAMNSAVPYSLISTCKNESRSISEWLDSVASQTLPPTELIICDGGSADNTLDLIRRWQNLGDLKCKVTVVQEPGANIARGRNLAAAHATCPYLLFTDAGCVLNPNWAEKLLAPLVGEKSMEVSEVSMGFYDVRLEHGVHTHVARLIVPQREHIDPATFLPSARSLGLLRGAWQKTGGFPEMLTLAGEDSLFDIRLKRVCSKFAFVPQARVHWNLPSTLRSMFQTIFRYSRGDAESGFLAWRHYLWLSKRASIFFASLGVLLACVYVRGHFGLRLILGAACSLLALRSLNEIGKPYRWFLEEGVTTREKLNRLTALVLVLLAQYSGFMTGLFTGATTRRLARLYVEQAPHVQTSAQSNPNTAEMH